MIERWQELDAIPRHRRTPAQQAEWQRLDILRCQRLRRLPGQLAAARDRVSRHEAAARALGMQV